MKPPEQDSNSHSQPTAKAPQLPPVLVHLLKGVVYRDQLPLVWRDLEALQGKVIDHFKTIGLDVVFDESGGFAYLKQIEFDDEDAMPRLIQRRPLSYPLTLLCVTLRKALIESDAAGGGSRVVLTEEQILESMKVFSPLRSDEAFTEEKIVSHIRKAVDLDLLKQLKADPPAYEIRPIIKALVDATWLQKLDETLKARADNGNRPT